MNNPNVITLNDGKPFSVQPLIDRAADFPLCDTKAAAILLNVAHDAVYLMVLNGNLPAVTLPGKNKRYINLRTLELACAEAHQKSDFSVELSKNETAA